MPFKALRSCVTPSLLLRVLPWTPLPFSPYAAVPNATNDMELTDQPRVSDRR